MIKVGILTLHRAINYGAVLQCWALKKACQKIGCDVETIDYNPFGFYSYKMLLKRKTLNAFKKILQLYIFNRFVATHLNPSHKTDSKSYIKDNPPMDDVYIVGSDTVWCDDIVGDLIDSYLLEWAPMKVRRISYAASTGGQNIRDCNIVKRELPKFSAISVREKSSIQNIQQYVDLTVEDVCDPTLLLQDHDFLELEEKKYFLPKKYIVLFDLANDEFTQACVKNIKNRLNCPIVNLSGKRRSWCDYNVLLPTVGQWLYIMRNACFICTNGFHGTAFSIIFKRPFICCKVSKGSRSNKNGRVENLLEQTNLFNRYIDEETVINDSFLELDYSFCEPYIHNYRRRSFNWLKNSIIQ